MPKAFTEEEKKWIRERLLQEGEKQFTAYGLRKTNIEELADAAGISKGAFYIFFESKEALFMDVIERAEELFRREVLASIELTGPSPRARLLVVFKKAFSLLKTMPLLQFLTGSDYERLFRRVPAERVQEHLASDRVFIQELITRCHEAGIPIQAQVEEISGLLYALVLTILHEEDFGPNQFGSTVDLLLELVAAFCLGEVEMQYQELIKLPSGQEKGWPK